MKLKQLLVYEKETSKKIREINFNLSGPSIIVDKTHGREEKVSGSSVGKTTAMRIIDLCLGAKSVTQIYKSKDISGTNIEVEVYLNDHKVIAELTILILLDGEEQECVLRRGLYKKGEFAIITNGIIEEFSSVSMYTEALNKFIFNNSHSKPSFRQLINFFARIDLTEDIIKYIPRGKTIDHQVAYDFLFKWNVVDSNNVSLVKDNDEIRKSIAVLLRKNGVETLEQLEAKVAVLESEVDALKNQYKDFDYLESYKENEHNYKQLKAEINNLEDMLSELQTNLNIVQKNVDRERGEIESIDSRVLRRLFEDTKGLSSNDITSQFDGYIQFHNSMTGQRIQMQLAELERLKQEVAETEQYLDQRRADYTDKYTGYSEALTDEYTTKQLELEKNRGNVDASRIDLNYISSLYGNIIQPTTNAENIVSAQTKLEEYNSILTEFSSKVKERFLISYDFNNLYSNGKPKFPMDKIGGEGKLGSSESKSQILCLIFAYIKYAKKQGFETVEFALTDYLELVDFSELNPLVDISRSEKIQFVFPVLSDHVDWESVNDEDIVLELSKDDKFFQI